MEALRIVIAFGFFGFAALAFFFFTDSPTQLYLSDAQLRKMGGGLALEVTINNPGKPDTLIGIGSEFAGQSSLMPPSQSRFPIPSGSTPKLAMDGLHGMLTNPHGSTEPGRLVPVTLWFEDAGPVTTRARIAEPANMAHGERVQVPSDQKQPDLSIDARETNDGWIISLHVENFIFAPDLVDAEHKPGTGHGHLYLNDLKIQRVFGNEVQIGTLPPGEYQIKISLNTNDHRLYSTATGPVVRQLTIISN